MADKAPKLVQEETVDAKPEPEATPKLVPEETVDAKPEPQATPNRPRSSPKRHAPRRPISPFAILLLLPLLVVAVVIAYQLFVGKGSPLTGKDQPTVALREKVAKDVPAGDGSGQPDGSALDGEPTVAVPVAPAESPADGETPETTPEELLASLAAPAAAMPEELLEGLLATADASFTAGATLRALELYQYCTRKHTSSPEAWLGQAKCAEKVGDKALALRTFVDAVEAVPKSVALRLAYAVHAMSIGNASVAAEQYSVAVQMAPESYTIRLAAARALFAARQETEALAYARRAAELGENQLQAKVLTGQILLRLGELDDAEAALLGATALAPEDPAAILGLAELSRRRGKHAEAERLLAKANAAIATAPANGERRTGQVPSGAGGFPAGLPPGARFDPVGTLEVKGQLERAELLLSQRKTVEAINVLRALQERHPRLIETRFRLGELLLLVGRAEESCALASKLAEEFPGEPSGACLFAEIYLAKGLYSDAAKECSKALLGDEGHPHQIRARKVHALILLRLGDAKRAATAMAEYIALRPNDLDAGLRYVGMLAKAGRKPDAIAWTDALYHRFPASPAPPLVRASLMALSADFDEATKAYQEAMRRGATGVELYNNLAWYLAVKLGKPEEALRHAQAGAKLYPNVVGMGHTLGWCLFLTGEAPGALPLLEAAARAAPNNPNRRYTLAAVEAQLGRKADAKREVEAALKLSASFEFATEARKLQARLAAE